MIGWLVLREQVISSFVRTMQLFARPWLLLDDIFAPPRMNITIIAVDTSLLIISSRLITPRWHFCSSKDEYYFHRGLIERVDTSLLIISSLLITPWWNFCSTKNGYYFHHLAKLGGIRTTKQMVNIFYYIEGEAAEKMKNGQSWQITNISITILFSSETATAIWVKNW